MKGRFAVTGGRDFNDPAMVRLALRHATPGTVLVHGAATGADTLAAQQWGWWGNPVEPHPADWKAHGKTAGVIRNQEMLESGIDYLIAFPGGKGTLDMVRRCKRAGVTVFYAAHLEPRVGA